MPLCKKKLAEEMDILREISKVQEAIKQKHKSLRLGRENLERAANEYFKPVVIPLKELTAKTLTPKVEETIKVKPEEDNIPVQQEQVEDFLDTESEAPISPTVEKYLMLIDTKHWDSIYGVRKFKSFYKIGDSVISFINDEIHIGADTYRMSIGLMELLFKKNPLIGKISTSDVENYKKIVKSTNAHRKHYYPTGAIRDVNDKKYIDFIYDPEVELKHEGAGLLPSHMTARKHSRMDYVYWDDPNELVDRLRLLIASRAAGNPTHDNEIMSIIEELREAGIIY